MSTDTTFYPIGTHVVLKGLQGAPEHNGKTGVVESTVGERQLVKLMFVFPDGDDSKGDDKVLGIRPRNLGLAPRPVDTLSIKELKLVLQACNYKGGGGALSGMDKRDLQDAVSEVASPDQTAQILVEQARKQQKQTSSPVASPTSGIDKDQIQTAADRMATMDPAQLRQQAAMMKAMPKDQLRRANPMFANMSDGQIDQMISQFEIMASNPAMMQQAANQVKNMTPEELQRQQAAVMGANATTGNSSSSSNTSSSHTGSTSTTTPTPPGSAAQMLSQMNPEQLKQQVAMLRSMPPQQLRSMHPQFSNMSDAQIEQTASQMEMMANNPAMLKMAADTMSNLTPEQIADIQRGRMPSGSAAAAGGGLGDASSSTAASMEQTAANVLSNMNGKQVKEMLKMAKENPEMFKTALPEGTDTSLMEKVINGLEGMDEKTLDRIIAVLRTLQKAFSPIIKVYQSTNQAAGGHLFKILAFALMAMLMYRWFGGGMTTTTTVTVDDTEDVTAMQSLSANEPDEFSDL